MSQTLLAMDNKLMSMASTSLLESALNGKTYVASGDSTHTARQLPLGADEAGGIDGGMALVTNGGMDHGMDGGMSSRSAVNVAIGMDGGMTNDLDGDGASVMVSCVADVVASSRDSSSACDIDSILADVKRRFDVDQNSHRKKSKSEAECGAPTTHNGTQNNDNHMASEKKKELGRQRTMKSKNNKMFLEQIGDDEVYAKRKVVTGTFTAGPENLQVSFSPGPQNFKIIDVVQCSEMKEIQLKAVSKGRRRPVIMGAVVKFEDGTYGGVETGRFLIDGVHCYAKDGGHDTAKFIPAKRLTGSVHGYVLIEWDWNKRENAWIAENRITGLGSDDIKRGANSIKATQSQRYLPKRSSRSAVQANPNEATQNQQLPTEEFKNADKFYDTFRNETFIDLCMKSKFGVTGMMKLGTVKWEILHRKKQKDNRKRETLHHKLKQMVLDNQHEREDLFLHFRNNHQMPEDYLHTLKEKQSLPRGMKEVVMKFLCPDDQDNKDQDDKDQENRDQKDKDQENKDREKKDQENKDQEYKELERKLVPIVVRLVKRKVVTPIADRPYPSIPAPPVGYPCMDLSLQYDFIRGNIHGSLGVWIDDAIGVSKINGQPDKYLHAIFDACQRTQIKERLTSQRAKRQARK